MLFTQREEGDYSIISSTKHICVNIGYAGFLARQRGSAIVHLDCKRIVIQKTTDHGLLPDCET